MDLHLQAAKEAQERSKIIRWLDRITYNNLQVAQAQGRTFRGAQIIATVLPMLLRPKSRQATISIAWNEYFSEDISNGGEPRNSFDNSRKCR